MAVTLAKVRFAATFCVFNRKFSIGSKCDDFHFQMLKSQLNAVNACVN
jgi:hypothetical protein